MIRSFYDVEFVFGESQERLVAAGDWIDADIAPKVSQGATPYAAIAAEYSEHSAAAGAVTTLDFAVIKTHADHAALRSYCLRAAASIPSGRTGIITIAVDGGETWAIQGAVLLSLAPVPKVPCKSFQTLTAYSAVGGRLVPLTPVPLYAGIPWDFILQDWDSLTADWDTF